ncbi:MAG: hypothetical protein H6698_03080 [Myxococcales bacterium]|nr:hypothetical protein [Myxococcales bacterium]MCB9533297.1 hypothetical protein [Myxococcales bacterium]
MRYVLGVTHEATMGTGRELVKANAKRKGWAAAATAAGTILAVSSGVALGLPLIAGAVAVVGGAATAGRVIDWLRYRGTWGLRF